MTKRQTTQHRFSPIVSPRPVEIVTAAIARAIHLGQIGIGQKLPAELEMARQLGVSRTILREALRNLAREGVVKIEPGAGGGTFAVKRPADWGLREPSLAILQLHELTDVLIARRVIEPRILEYAAGRATHEDLDAMHDAIAPARGLQFTDGVPSEEEVEVLSLAAVRFSIALGRATHSHLLAQFMETLTHWMEPVRRIAVRNNPQAAVDSLDETLRAIELNDFELIQKMLEQRFGYLESVWESETGRRLWREVPHFLPRT